MSKASINKIYHLVDSLYEKAQIIDNKNAHSRSFALRKNIAIFSESLFSSNSDKMVDYLDEVTSKTGELEKLLIKSPTLFKARLQLIEEQISAIINALHANEPQNKASGAHLSFIKKNKLKQAAKKLFQPTQELYQKLSETLEFERRLVEMLHNKQSELACASQKKSQSISNELLIIHQRLGRCRQAISKVERQIELSEKR